MSAFSELRTQNSDISKRGMGKRGQLHSFVLQIIIVGLIFVMLLMAVSGRVNARDVHQQVLEKQLALLIDASESGMEFSVRKINVKGIVDSVEVREGRVFIGVDGLRISKGYPYFSRYDVSVVKEEDKFVVRIR